MIIILQHGKRTKKSILASFPIRKEPGRHLTYLIKLLTDENGKTICFTEWKDVGEFVVVKAPCDI